MYDRILKSGHGRWLTNVTKQQWQRKHINDCVATGNPECLFEPGVPHHSRRFWLDLSIVGDGSYKGLLLRNLWYCC